MGKKADNKPSKKNELKKKEKVIEDKTFGLKNKKGNKNQQYIAQVEKQVKSGGDPKSVFCAFFKQGLCKKGDKCKFSHDPDVERKSAKRSIYTDTAKDQENDNMEDWDDEKLADVVGQKHGNEKKNDTDIICKYFLD